jgi:AraC-like DNA-binding protein
MVDKRVRDVLQLLDREWHREVRVSDLALSVNLCPSRLSHLVKVHANQSIREMVQARRLEEAAKLIARTYERISEIAYTVGFRDVPNFNHAFRRRFGMSPTQYRRQAQAGTTRN